MLPRWVGTGTGAPSSCQALERYTHQHAQLTLGTQHTALAHRHTTSLWAPSPSPATELEQGYRPHPPPYLPPSLPSMLGAGAGCAGCSSHHDNQGTDAWKHPHISSWREEGAGQSKGTAPATTLGYMPVSTTRILLFLLSSTLSSSSHSFPLLHNSQSFRHIR